MDMRVIVQPPRMGINTAMAPGVPCNCLSFWLKVRTVSQQQRMSNS
jgi:hypothetical protein